MSGAAAPAEEASGGAGGGKAAHATADNVRHELSLDDVVYHYIEFVTRRTGCGAAWTAAAAVRNSATCMTRTDMQTRRPGLAPESITGSREV